jgi:hypothetical protein
MSSTIRRSENLIALEILVGIGLSVPFIIVTLNLGNEFWGDDYFTGLLRFYGGLSILFFASVFIVGIIGAIISKLSERIAAAVLYAIGFWLLSLVVTAVTAEFLRLFSAYFMLAGITYGFNYGLRRNTATKIDDPES